MQYFQKERAKLFRKYIIKITMSNGKKERKGYNYNYKKM